MAMYLMLAIMGLALGALLVPMVIITSRTTRLDTSRVHAIDAAHAGIDVMLGQIRAAQVNGVGTSTLLPVRIEVRGRQRHRRRRLHGDHRLLHGRPSGDARHPVKMRCVPGYGTYDPVTDSFTPKFARITSTGTDGTAVQRLHPGSHAGHDLRLPHHQHQHRRWPDPYLSGVGQLGPSCAWTPTTAAPTAGTIVKLQTCTDPPADQAGLRLPQRPHHPAAVVDQRDLPERALPRHDAGTDRRRRPSSSPPCQPAGSPTLWTQQWSFNDDGTYEASKSTSARPTASSRGMCLSAASQNAGLNVTTAGCSDGSTTSPTQAWIPAPSVGAGAAQAPQLVNYYEFGRCLDVTNQNVDCDHLIDFPCKQNPYPAAVRVEPEVRHPDIADRRQQRDGQIYTTPPSGGPSTA